MDTIGLVLALLSFALGFAYGGYSLNDAHPFLAVVSYLFAIGCVVGAIGVGAFGPRKFASEKENKSLRERVERLTKPQLIAVQPMSGKVPQWQTISGIVHPHARLVQIFVGTGPIGDKWWYRQNERATVDGFIWTCRCKFGDDGGVSGWQFDLCAIIPDQLILDSRVRELPANAIKSEIVTVILDRSMTNDT